jgi:acetyl esterase/lipase
MIQDRLRPISYFFIHLLPLLLLTACSSSPTGPKPTDNIVEGVNLTQVFKAPSAAEISAISDEWETRDVSARDVQVMRTSAQTVGGTSVTVRIVAHTVGGYRHFGAVIEPPGKQIGSLPMLVYSHGGESGENLSLTLSFLPSELAALVGEFVVVVPSFRSEPLIYGGHAYVSEGPPSPWDYDVDDALALLNAAIEITPPADPTHIGVVGFSRGAGVGMLMAIRDPRIDAVVEFFGPTDFFGSYIQTLTEEALRGHPRNLPGLNYLNTTFIQPLKEGKITIADFRREMVRRSAVLFAGILPQLQIHHGTADVVVEVSQAQSLIDAMTHLGHGEPEFEYYLYNGSGHDFSTMTGSLDRTVAFLERLRMPVLASAASCDPGSSPEGAFYSSPGQRPGKTVAATGKP